MRALVIDALVFTVLVGLAFAPLEHLWPARGGMRTGRATDLAFATLGHLLSRFMLFAGVGTALVWLDSFAPATPLVRASAWLGTRGDSFLALLVEVGIGLLVFELMGYAYHRLAHALPWLWRLHAVHHSPTSLDWLASFRQHPLEIVLATLLQNAPLVLLGIPLGAHALVVLMLRVHTVYVHSDLRMPEGAWTELIATPRFHHRHHQREGAPTNFAALFPFIDRLFGTYDADESSELGIAETMPSDFVGLLLHPFGFGRAAIQRREPRSRA